MGNKNLFFYMWGIIQKHYFVKFGGPTVYFFVCIKK